MESTTKNAIVLDFISINHNKGSFKAFKNEQIEMVKNEVIKDYLYNGNNDVEILGHWHKTFLNILQKRLLSKLIEN